jgi:hypothetical protein
MDNSYSQYIFFPPPSSISLRYQKMYFLIALPITAAYALKSCRNAQTGAASYKEEAKQKADRVSRKRKPRPAFNAKQASNRDYIPCEEPLSRV